MNFIHSNRSLILTLSWSLLVLFIIEIFLTISLPPDKLPIGSLSGGSEKLILILKEIFSLNERIYHSFFY